MNERPDVSVVVPCRNHAPFLAERLTSILGQTVSPLEVIFLDDGSTDGSFEAARAFAADARLRLVRADPPTGNPFAAWSLGVSQARGGLIWIAESDDACEPDFLAGLVPLFAADSGLGLAYCQSLAIDAAGRVTGSLAGHTDAVDGLRWRADFRAEGPQECRRALLLRNTIPNASACLFRAEALRAALPAAAGYRICGDWAVYAALLGAGWRLAFWAEPKNRFRRHAASQQADLARSGLEIAETVRVKRTILATVGGDAESVAASSAMTLERLVALAGAAGAETASAWFADGRLLADFLAFDPHFLAGLTGASPGRYFLCDVYSGGEGGFVEERKASLRYPPNRPASLSLLCPTGPLRLDPTQSPGLVRLHGVTLSGEDGRLLAAWQGEGLRALCPGGTGIVVACDAAGLLLWSHGDDPWLLLPQVAVSGARVRLDVQLTGYSLTPGVAPFPGKL